MNKSNNNQLIALTFGKVQLLLLPNRVAIDPKHKTLFVSDVHYGKDSTFRKVGQYVPEVAANDLDRLGRLIDHNNITTVVIVGDLIHSTASLDFKYLDEFIRNSSAKFILVAGNHDRHAMQYLQTLKLTIVPQYDHYGIILVHDRNDVTDSQAYTISGHEHPSVFIPGEGYLRAFVQQGDTLILPAFGSLCGSKTFKISEVDRVWVMGEDQIVEI